MWKLLLVLIFSHFLLPYVKKAGLKKISGKGGRVKMAFHSPGLAFREKSHFKCSSFALCKKPQLTPKPSEKVKKPRKLLLQSYNDDTAWKSENGVNLGVK